MRCSYQQVEGGKGRKGVGYDKHLWLHPAGDSQLANTPFKSLAFAMGQPCFCHLISIEAASTASLPIHL